MEQFYDISETDRNSLNAYVAEVFSHLWAGAASEKDIFLAECQWLKDHGHIAAAEKAHAAAYPGDSF